MKATEETISLESTSQFEEFSSCEFFLVVCVFTEKMQIIAKITDKTIVPSFEAPPPQMDRFLTFCRHFFLFSRSHLQKTTFDFTALRLVMCFFLRNFFSPQFVFFCFALFNVQIE